MNDVLSISPLATPEQVAEYLGTTTAALAQMRYQGIGPRFIKVTARKVRYRLSDVEAFIEEKARTRTDQTRTPAA